MRAKEYAQKFLDSPRPDEESYMTLLKDTIWSMLQEIQGICKSRNSFSNGTVLGAYKEQEQKWGAFARIVNKGLEAEVVKTNALSEFVKLGMPELYTSIVQARQENKSNNRL